MPSLNQKQYLTYHYKSNDICEYTNLGSYEQLSLKEWEKIDLLFCRKSLKEYNHFIILEILQTRSRIVMAR